MPCWNKQAPLQLGNGYTAGGPFWVDGSVDHSGYMWNVDDVDDVDDIDGSHVVGSLETALAVQSECHTVPRPSITTVKGNLIVSIDACFIVSSYGIHGL